MTDSATSTYATTWDLPDRAPKHLGLDISYGPVPEHLPCVRWAGHGIQIGDGQALIHFDEGARLLIADGGKVTIDLPPSSDAWIGDHSWLVQGWAVAVAHMQTGGLTLHAALVELGGRTLAIAGDPGAGKSTTSMGLVRRGHGLLADDATLLDFRDGDPYAIPFARNVHLLPDAAAGLGIDFSSLRRLAGERDKAALVPLPPDPHPRKLDVVAVLKHDRDAKGVVVHEVRGVQRLRELRTHTVRMGMAPVLLGEEGYFMALTRLSAACRVFVVRRPTDDWTVEEVMDAVEAVASTDRPDDRLS